VQQRQVEVAARAGAGIGGPLPGAQTRDLAAHQGPVGDVVVREKLGLFPDSIAELLEAVERRSPGEVETLAASIDHEATPP